MRLMRHCPTSTQFHPTSRSHVINQASACWLSAMHAICMPYAWPVLPGLSESSCLHWPSKTNLQFQFQLESSYQYLCSHTKMALFVHEIAILGRPQRHWLRNKMPVLRDMQLQVQVHLVRSRKEAAFASRQGIAIPWRLQSQR